MLLVVCNLGVFILNYFCGVVVGPVVVFACLIVVVGITVVAGFIVVVVVLFVSDIPGIFITPVDMNTINKIAIDAAKKAIIIY